MSSLKGKKQSAEHIAKRRAAWQLSTAKDKASKRFSELNKSREGCSLPVDHKEKIAKSMVGKKNSLGVKRTVEFREKLSDYWAENKEKHNHYVDGLGHIRGSERVTEMSRLPYRLWRESVFKRDGWKCILCSSNKKIQADHIKPYSLFPSLRLDINNGRTLCYECHSKTDTFCGRVHKLAV